jgi:hypothetical protein
MTMSGWARLRSGSWSVLEPVPTNECRESSDGLRPAPSLVEGVGSELLDVFVVERAVSMSSADWASWLIASGSPWGELSSGELSSLCQARDDSGEHLNQTFSLFLLIEAR